MKKRSLTQYNSFGIKAKADKIIPIYSVKELIDCLSIYKNQFILGGGTNVLFTNDFHGEILKMEIKGIEILRYTDPFVTVVVGAGVLWHDFVSWAVKMDFGGVENLALIPGTVGAAPIQNIGAYGVELKDVFIKCSVVEKRTKKRLIVSLSKANFGYRNSIFKQKFKNKYVITQVFFKLKTKKYKVKTHYGNIEKVLEEKNINSPSIKDVFNIVINIRQSKLPDPKVIGNAGSFFKNPIIPLNMLKDLIQTHPDIPYYHVITNETFKIPAAWLLDQAGWKGKVVGNTGCYENQPIVLVNHGNATGKEIFDLSESIIEDIQKKFGIKLEREVNII